MTQGRQAGKLGVATETKGHLSSVRWLGSRSSRARSGSLQGSQGSARGCSWKRSQGHRRWERGPLHKGRPAVALVDGAPGPQWLG